VTLTGSNLSTNSAFGGGGGIYNADGTLSVTGGSLTSNTAPIGGAIYNDTGSATVTGCNFSNFMYNAATLTVTGCFTSSSTAGIENTGH